MPYLPEGHGKCDQCGAIRPDDMLESRSWYSDRWGDCDADVCIDGCGMPDPDPRDDLPAILSEANGDK